MAASLVVAMLGVSQRDAHSLAAADDATLDSGPLTFSKMFPYLPMRREAASRHNAVLLQPEEAPIKLIVTGGAGYVGSHTLLELQAAGYNVTVVDDLENGHSDAVPAAFSLAVVKTDDAPRLTEVFEAVAPKAVIDFAAYLDVGQSQSEPEEYLRNNVVNFKHVLNAMVSSGTKLIVKSSTQATYGDADQALMPLNETYNAANSPWAFNASQLAEGNWSHHALSGTGLFDAFIAAYNNATADEAWLALTPVDLTMLYFPKSIYGVSKLLDEVLLSKYEARHGIRYVALRYGNVCGADPDGRVGEAKRKPHTLLTLAIYSLLGHGAVGPKPLKLYGTDYATHDGTTVRDYVHPSDLGRAHASALRYLLAGNHSDVFNLGTGVGSSVFDVLGELKHVSNRSVQYETFGRRTGDCSLSVLDIQKARDVLGYVPVHDLHSMATTAWRWHFHLNETFHKTGESKAARVIDHHEWAYHNV